MKCCACAVVAAGLIGTIGFTLMGAAHAQPESEPKKPAAPAPVIRQRPEVQLLADMCGDFDLKITVWARPDSKPIVLNATAHRQMTLANQFMEERVEGGPYSSVSYMSYNPDAKDGPRFEVARMSSTAPCIMPETGIYDAPTRTFTLRGEHQLMGMFSRVKNVIDVSDLDHQKVEAFTSFEGYTEKTKDMKVPEYKGALMEYTRKK